MPSTTVAESVHLLRLGQMTAPHRVVLFVADGASDVTVPITAFLVLSGERRILVDCGLSAAAAAASPEQLGGITPHVGPDDTVAARLAAFDLGVEDVTDVVLTHMHHDHAGGVAELPRARRWIQRAEHRHGLSPDPNERLGYIPHELAGNYELLDGDAPIAPGVYALFTPGHSHGHQSVLVHLPGDRWVCLTGDVAGARRVIDEQRVPGTCVDPAEALRSIARLRLLEHALSAELIFSHDAEQHARLPPDHV